jgi:two-component system, NtrC family, sensor kinase
VKDADRVRILLVEDDEDDFVLTRTMLREAAVMRFEVDWEDTYPGGLDRARAGRHDLYLIDYRLGQRTGLDLVREAWGSDPPSPVILVTGQADCAVDLEAAELGVAGYLVKGKLDPPSLERTIRYAIRHHDALLALRRSEERWRTLLAHTSAIVILIDPDGAIVYSSPSVQRWLGYAAEELQGEPLGLIGHPEDARALAAAFARCAPGAPVSLNHRVEASDGSWRSLESTLVCLRENSAVGGVLIAARDVTERIALEKERERLELDRRVSQRLETVGQLAAGIAHEINTPLQFVGDSVTFLRDAVDDLVALIGTYRDTLYTPAPIGVAERRQSMREAEERVDVEYLCERIPAAFGRTMDGVERVRSIVQAMKRFSHTSGVEAAPADINEALETTLVVCRSEYKYVANVVLELDELPEVTCNIGELNQVFLNMIINAAQAIEEKVGETGEQGEIRISTRRDGDEVVVDIADDGPGIPAAVLDRIYEPFFTTKEIGKGTGQGLALARATVERHAGSLECTSEPGQGTRFTIRLPVGGPPPVELAAVA